MKLARRWFPLFFACWVSSVACLIAGPSRAEVKAWTKAREAGAVARDKGDFREAWARYQDALRLAEGFGPKDLRLVQSLRSCGMLLMFTHEPAHAEPLLRRAAVLWEGIYDAAHRETAVCWLEHAEALIALDRFAEAEALIRRARGNFIKGFGVHTFLLGYCFQTEAKLQVRRKQFAEAEALYLQAIEFLSRTDVIIRPQLDGYSLLKGEVNRSEFDRAQAELVLFYGRGDRPIAQVSECRKVVESMEARRGAAWASLPLALIGLADAQIKARDFAGAKATIDRTEKLVSKAAGKARIVGFAVRRMRMAVFLAQEQWKAADDEGLGLILDYILVVHHTSELWHPVFAGLAVAAEKLGEEANAKSYLARAEELNAVHQVRLVPASP